MDAEASQKRKGMVSGSVSVGRIRVTTSPSEDRSTINDEITGSNQSGSKSLQDRQDKQRFMQRCSSYVATSALL
jgi:hypothetical protein